jgi:hypothetical protein
MAIVFVVGLAGTSSAAVVTLSDRNSTLNVDPDSQAGVSDWTVSGTDHLAQQWFWYRIGNTAEASIDTLFKSFQSVNNIDPDAGNEILTVVYRNNADANLATFQITLTLTLQGTNIAGDSDLGEQILIESLNGATLDFHFFQYADFDLNGTAGDDVGWFELPNAVLQADPVTELSETIVSPPANHRELKSFSTTRDSLNDGAATTLDDTPDDFSDTGEYYPGVITGADVTWAFQWDRTISPTNSLQISKDKRLEGGVPDRGPLVPEPASLAIWGGLAAVGLVVGRLRRKSA